MHRFVRLTRRSHFLLISILLLSAGWVAPVSAAGPGVERIGPLAAASAPDDIKKAVEDQGYRVTLNDGWTAEFWFAHPVATTHKDAPGALYPELANGEFVAVVNYPKGASDFRGQAIPAGFYTLRYQYLPQDANHMGVSPNPDFLLAIPIAADSKPADNLAFRLLVKLSAKTTGTAHPAVIALAPAGDPGAVAQSEGLTVFSVAIPKGDSSPEKIGIVVKGQATQ
ncbi:MAG: hypothetical protein WBS19_07645 [Candidatus Korobacteraceae bacterium]